MEERLKREEEHQDYCPCGCEDKWEEIKDEKEEHQIMDKLKMIEIYKEYGFDMPVKAIYKRDINRIYFSGDFQDNEELDFFWNCEKPSACAIGNAFYMNKHGISHLINIKEIVCCEK